LSRTHRFFNGLIFAYGYQALVMVAGLWLTPFLLHHLGQHDYGLWLTALQILSYVTLVDLGVVAVVPRTVAYATGRAGGNKNPAELSRILGQTALVVLWQTPLVALIAAGAWLLLPTAWTSMRGPLELILATYAFLFPLRIFAAVLEGLQEQAIVIRVGMVSWAVGTLANVGLLLAGFGLYALTIGWILSQVFNSAACAWRMWTAHREVIPRRLPKFSKADMLPQLGSSFWVSFNQIGQVLMAGSDILLISKIMGPALVVPYSITGKLASVLQNQPQILMHLATPGLSEMKTASSKESIYRVSAALSQGLLLLTGLICCVVLVVNEEFVRVWVGSKQYGGFALTCLILLAMLLRHWNQCMAYTVFSFGYERRLAISGLFDGIVTATVTFLAVPHFQYIGAMAGSLAGVCLVTLPVNLITAARELEIPVVRLVRPFWPWFWRFVLVASLAGFGAQYRPPQSLLQLVVAGAIITAIYCLVMFRPILSSPLGPYFRQVAERVGQFLGSLVGPPAEKAGQP